MIQIGPWIGLTVAVLVLHVGCTGPIAPSPLPTTAISTTAPSAKPTPSGAASLGPPTDQPSGAAGTPVAPELVIERFIQFTSTDTPFHVTVNISGRGSHGQQQVSGETHIDADVSGDAVSANIQEALEGVGVDVIAVDGRYFERLPGGVWAETTEDVLDQPIRPASGLSAADIEHGSTINRKGQVLHQLMVNRWGGPSASELGFPRAEIELILFEIYVDDNGVPNFAQVNYRVSGRTFGEPTDITFVAGYEFSKVGVPVTITAPVDGAPI